MSKAQFVRLASVLKGQRPGGVVDKAALDQWRRMVESLADFCAEQNPRFNRHAFLTACGAME